MTTNASALPALLPQDTDTRKLNQYVNMLIRFFNRPDLFVPSYAADSGSGTAYVTTPSADIKFYKVGQEFDFKAANANTVTNPTLNVQGLGAGTITKNGGAPLAIGDIAANSFPKVIVSSTTPTFELTSAPGGTAGKLLQTVSTIVSTVATGTTVIPSDNTIPQNTEGDQYMSLAITPQSAASKLIIDIVWGGASSAGAGTLTAALFQDSTANALAALPTDPGAGSTSRTIAFRYVMTSGATTATTFKVRAGNSAGGTTTFNGQAGGQFFGGVFASSIVIQEVLP